MNLIEKGIKEGLIKFDEEEKYITYIHQNKKRNYTNPEEKIQAETYLKLILIYGYSPQRIVQFVSVTMGISNKEADIIVYNDDKLESTHIVVECKKQEVSELEFKQAIEQGFSYAIADGAKYVWVTSGIKNDYYLVPTEKPKARQSIPDIPQFGVTKLAKFKYAKNGGESNGQKLFELEIVSEDDLTRRFKQAHNALWGGGELNPSTAFDELDKLIFCKIWDEKKPRKKGEAYDFQIFSEDSEEKTNLELINRIKSLYDEGRKKDPEVFKDDIRLTAEKLRTVVGYLEGINLGATDLDSKGRAFETFMGSFFRGDFGQYFTPRNIVKFIVDVLPITNDSLVLDTSCGSGGFLLHVLDKIRQQAKEYYDKESVEYHRYWHDFAEKNLFGIEINEQIARTAKMNMIIHDDGHTNVISADGLLPSQEIINKTNNHGFAYNKFDFIVTNPPFGSSVKLTEQAYMKNYHFAKKEVDWLNPNTRQSVRDNQNTEILFIEQCYNFLRENGYLAIVIPDGILTNSSLQYVRDGIEEKFRIVAVISLPQTAFTATGAGVKSSVLFLKKYDLATTEKIQHDKLSLQDSLKVKHNFDKLLTNLDKEKKDKIKKLMGFDNVNNLEGKALQNSEVFKEWKKEVSNEYKEKVDEIKESLLEEYLTAKQHLLSNYNIFMAIAEDIGYDATGKATNNNELDIIALELTRFIENIERVKDSFFLAENMEKNKIFLVKLSELEGRIEPIYYTENFTHPIKILESKRKITKLSKLCTKITDGTHFTPSYIDYGVMFLSVKNVRQNQIFFLNTKFIEEKEHQKLIKRSKPESGDILLTKVGNTYGFAAVIPDNCPEFSIFVSLALLKVIKSKVNPYFIMYFLNSQLGKIQMDRLIKGIGQPDLHLEDIANIKIPLLSFGEQEIIINIMDNAYNAKKEKEKEAEKLLNSIDDYLLKELGIELPKQAENTVKSRIFCRKLSEISCSRFDAYYYQKNFYENRLSIQTSPYQIKSLKEIINGKLIKGRLPKDSEKDGDYQVIQINSINSNGYINFENLLTAKNIFKEEQKLNKQDIIIVITGATIGKMTIFDHDGDFYLGGDLVKFQVNQNINPYYIYAFLKCEISQIEIKKNITGATNGHLAYKDIANMIIPIPQIEKQNEIAENITKIREKAKQLQVEAKRGLEEAKIEVEKMILG